MGHRASRPTLQEPARNQTSASLPLGTLTKHVLLRHSKGNSNVVFSPLSIQLMLGLIAVGTKGATQKELLSFLNSNSVDDLNSLASQMVATVLADESSSGGPSLSFANSIWVDQTLPLKPFFKHLVGKVYRAASFGVDFQTKAIEVSHQVNMWAENETNGLIKEILPSNSVDQSTMLIVANALYFKGTWNEKFEASRTNEFQFHLLSGRSVQVPFMISNTKQYISAFDGFKVLKLPYKQGKDKCCFSMYLFLPDANDRLPVLVDKVCSEPGFVENHLPHQKVEVSDFRIPKFKLSFGFEASKVLRELGIKLLFSGNGITEMANLPWGGNLYISRIYHKSFIEVNEEGTEAAAATASLMFKSLDSRVGMDFVADHPFLFLIREDKTGALLFIGNMLNPNFG